MPSYDALLILSFGGPEQPADVMPFLENVLRGRNVPPQRMHKVAEHYYLFGGKSPINDQCRALITALREEFRQHGVDLPVYWGNRNWNPMLADTVRQMTVDGVKRALVFVTAAYSSYSTCRQYLEDLERAVAQVEGTPPIFEKLGHFYANPGFLEPNIEAVRQALRQVPGAPVLFTAHSIPQAMADSSHYVQQLTHVARSVAEANGVSEWRLVYQSRSGPPSQPWLEPDILDALKQLKESGRESVVVSPVGFISDHMEVIYDLDVEAAQRARELDLKMVRAATAGCHPRFVQMIRELVGQARAGLEVARPCLVNCCPAPVRPGAPGAAGRP